MLADLIRKIDVFVEQYGGSHRDKMKAELIDLAQTAINHGEDKDQTKIAGIAMKVLKGIFSRTP